MRIVLRILVLAMLLTGFTSLAAVKKPKMQKAKPIGQKPDITRLEPRGLQRGVETKIKLTGTNFIGLTELKFSSPKITAEILDGDDNNTEAWVKIKADADLPRAAYDAWAVNEKGDSAKVKLYVDNLPVAYATNQAVKLHQLTLPTVYWGTIAQPADLDVILFQAKAGQTLVFDLAAQSIGSKANTMIKLFDDQENLLASNNGYDGTDPLLVHTFAKKGHYHVRISDEAMGGSPDHFYRLALGELPVVVAAYPLSVKKQTEAEVELIGYNLPAAHRVKIKADMIGEVDVPINAEAFRARRPLKVLVTEDNEIIESEPNDTPAQANTLTVPGVVSGRIWPRKGEAADVDLYQFAAKKEQRLVVEIMAARRGSPVDTKIEILHPDGTPVQRLVLQAVRNSQINFRPIDSVTSDIRVENWQEMELNELMYLQGEVCKIFRMPEGPDSGFQFYSAGGKRLCYFDTSPTAHPLDEDCYIVEPHPPGTVLVPNGLPMFPVYYANDDDGERKNGADAKIFFAPPADGNYLVRVSDTRGWSGERFSYRLMVHEAKPDFKVTLNGSDPTVGPGSGQEFTLTLDRLDHFEEDVRVDITGMPPGFTVSTPIVIQAGHLEAKGSINAALDAKTPAAEELSKIKVSASALIKGQSVVKEVNSFGKIKVGEKPKLMVALEPYVKDATNFVERTIIDPPLEITIAPGEIIPVWLKMKRLGHDDLATFGVENLPHGVIVDNLGLNGVLIPKGENERQIFIKAAKWVSEMDCLIYCQAKQVGLPTSLPVLLHVRKIAGTQTAATRP